MPAPCSALTPFENLVNDHRSDIAAVSHRAFSDREWRSLLPWISAQLLEFHAPALIDWTHVEVRTTHREGAASP